MKVHRDDFDSVGFIPGKIKVLLLLVSILSLVLRKKTYRGRVREIFKISIP